MRFFEPWGLLALLGVPVIILLYLLKQKYKDAVVSSLFLWKAGLNNTEAQRPWQKLRKNMLILMQILAVILLALALANPIIMGKEQNADYILVIDSSMSMQAKDISPSRFDAAKGAIRDMVENAPPDTGFSLVLAGNSPSVLVVETKNKQELFNALSRLQPTLSSVNWEETMALLDARQKQYGGDIYIFSDSVPPLVNVKAECFVFANGGENCAVIHISHNQTDDGYQALIQVKNFGMSEAKRTLTLFCDDVPFDLVEISLAPKEQRDIVFAGIPLETESFSARITPGDVLWADDVYYDAATKGGTNKVLLVTEGSMFIEKALSIMPGVELFKTSPENMETLSGYALYIFDGVMPEELPSDGHIMAFHLPIENPFVTLTDLEESNISAHGEGAGRLSFMEQTQFLVSEPKGISVPPWAQKIIAYGENAIGVAGEQEGRKCVLFSFDLNKTDFPLKMEFPIMLYHFISWYFPQGSTAVANTTAQTPIAFELLPSAKTAKVVLPSGETINVEDNLPTPIFENTSQAGIYTLLQFDDKGLAAKSRFAVNPDVLKESDLADKTEASSGEAAKTSVKRTKSLQNSILVLLLILLIMEWRVSLRES